PTPRHAPLNPHEPLLPQLYRGDCLSTSCVAVSTQSVREVGGLDESLRSAQDYDLWLKLSRNGHLVFVPEPLGTYVIRENSISSRTRTRYECMCLLARRHAPFVARLVGSRRALLL